MKEPKFKHGDEVEIIRGFYRGKKLRLIDHGQAGIFGEDTYYGIGAEVSHMRFKESDLRLCGEEKK